MGDYDALTLAERDRLERFAAEFDAIDPLGYGMFAGTTASPGSIETALGVAATTLGTAPRRKAVRAAATAFVQAAERAIGRELALPGIVVAPRSSALAPDQRPRFVAALERAVMAVVLWPDLTDVERDVLLGPWAGVADRALGTEP